MCLVSKGESRQARFVSLPPVVTGVWLSLRTILGPKPTTIHFSCGPGSNLCISTLVGTPVCLTGVLCIIVQCKAERCRFAAALDNSFVMHVQLLNMRPIWYFICLGRGELGDGDTANSFSFAWLVAAIHYVDYQYFACSESPGSWADQKSVASQACLQEMHLR